MHVSTANTYRLRFLWILLAVCISGLSAQAASVSLDIQGTVPPTAAVNISTASGTSANQSVTLDLNDTSGFQSIGSFIEKSNNPAGYKVVLQSATGVSSGTVALKATQPANTSTVGYTIKYAGIVVAFVDGQAEVTSATARTGAEGVTKAVQIKIHNNTAPAGSYTDTITVVVTAN